MADATTEPKTAPPETESSGWFSTAASRIWGGIKSVGNAIVNPIDTAVAVGGAIAGGVKAVGSGIGWVGGKVADGASWLGNGAVWVAKNPGEALSATGSALKTAAVQTGGFLKYAFYDDPAQAAKLLGNGLLNGVSSMAGLAGDLVVGIHNNTFRHIGNLGRENPIPKYKHNYATDWPKATTFVEIDPNGENVGYQRTLLYSGQAVSEIAAFVGVSAVTAGVGGAALATARAGGTAARILATGVEVTAQTSLLRNIWDSTKTGFKAGYNWTTPLTKQGARADFFEARGLKAANKAAYRKEHGAKWYQRSAEHMQDKAITLMGKSTDIRLADNFNPTALILTKPQAALEGTGAAASFGFNMHAAYNPDKTEEGKTALAELADKVKEQSSVGSRTAGELRARWSQNLQDGLAGGSLNVKDESTDAGHNKESYKTTFELKGLGD